MSFFAIILSVLGNIISTCTALSPVKSFLEIDKNRDVGKLNIYPIIALCGNSLCWVIYGTVIKDISILPVNVIGLFVTGYFISIFISACNELNKRRLVSGVIFGYLAGLTIYHLIILFYVDHDTQTKIFGITCNVVVLIFYGSPVLVLYGVIRSRDRSVINLPLALVSCLAGLIWTFYGIVVQNPYVAIPNAVGASLSAISLVVYFGVGYANAISNRLIQSTPDGASQDVALIINQDKENSNNQLNDDIELEEEEKI